MEEWPAVQATINPAGKMVSQAIAVWGNDLM
jgi:hypothetical protein